MPDAPRDSKSVSRMRRHRERMAEVGFKQVTTHIPAEIIDFLDAQRRIRGLSSRGHVLAALVRESETFQQYKESAAAE